MVRSRTLPSDILPHPGLPTRIALVDSPISYAPRSISVALCVVCENIWQWHDKSILLDILLCSIVCSIFTSFAVFWRARRARRARFIIQRFRFPKILTYQGFDLSRGRGNETSTNIVWYLYSFRAFFVLYEAVLENNSKNCICVIRF